MFYYVTSNHPPDLCCYFGKNRGEYLRQALVSLQLQTISDFECIIVDDYSSEDLRGVIDALQDARFIYVKNTGKPGISSARNIGNSLARAEWIAAADSDDIYLPRRLELTLEAINNNPEVDVVHANMYFIGAIFYEIHISMNHIHFWIIVNSLKS